MGMLLGAGGCCMLASHTAHREATNACPEEYVHPFILRCYLGTPWDPQARQVSWSERAIARLVRPQMHVRSVRSMGASECEGPRVARSRSECDVAQTQHGFPQVQKSRSGELHRSYHASRDADAREAHCTVQYSRICGKKSRHVPCETRWRWTGRTGPGGRDS